MIHFRFQWVSSGPAPDHERGGGNARPERYAGRAARFTAEVSGPLGHAQVPLEHSHRRHEKRGKGRWHQGAQSVQSVSSLVTVIYIYNH